MEFCTSIFSGICVRLRETAVSFFMPITLSTGPVMPMSVM